MSEPTFKYWAFISYSQRDGAWAKWLHGSIESYRVPSRLVGTPARDGRVPARLFPVFRDREELPVSADLGGNLRACLADSRYLIVLCSPRSSQSRWVNEEIAEFQRLGRANRILALILEGEPNSGDARECFPQALCFPPGSNGVPAEPIAADIRPGKDAKKDALLKLIAGLLGVNFDALKQRELARRRRRRLAWSIVVLLLAAAGVGLWKYQDLRREADLHQQQQAAEAHLADTKAGAAARQRRQQAEIARETGRKNLSGGDAIVAARQLQTAHRLQPDDAAGRLMLGVALRRLEGLSGVFRHPGGKIDEAIFSPDGTRLLLLGGGRLSLWTVKDGQLIWPGADAEHSAERAVFDSTGRRLLLSNNGSFSIVDLGTHLEVPVKVPEGAAVEFLGDGSQLIAGTRPENGQQGRILIFDTERGANVREIPLGRGGASRIQCDSGGRTALLSWWEPGAGLPKPSVKWIEVATGHLRANVPGADAGADAQLAPDGSAFWYQRPDNQYEVCHANGKRFLLADKSGRGLPRRWSRTGRGIIAMSQPGNGTSWWDPANGRRTAQVDYAPESFDPREEFMAEAEESGTVRILEVKTGRVLRCFMDRIGWPEAEYHHQRAAFSPDGRLVVVYGEGGSARLWDWESIRSEPLMFSASGGLVNGVAIDPAGTRLATVSEDRATRIWDLRTQELRTTLPGSDSASPWRVLFSPDGRNVAAEFFMAARIWEADTGRMLPEPRWPLETVTHRGSSTITQTATGVASLVSYAGGRMITVDSGFGKGALWDATTQAEVGRFAIPTGGGVQRLVATPEAGLFFATSQKGSVHVFRVEDGSFVATIGDEGSPLLAAGLSQQGRHAFTLSDEGRLRWWSLPDGRMELLLHQGQPPLNDAALSNDGRWLAAGAADGQAWLWPMEPPGSPIMLERQRPLGTPDASLGAPIDLTQPGGTRVRPGLVRVALDPAGRWIAGAHEQGSLSIWDIKTGKQLLYFSTPASRDIRLAVSVDGRWIAVAGGDSTARVFELPTITSTPDEIARRWSSFLEGKTPSPSENKAMPH